MSIEKLEDFKVRIDDLLASIENKTTLDGFERHELQTKLEMLKRDLKEEVSAKSEISGDCNQAACELRMRVDSHPIHANWISCLVAARRDITHAINREQK